MSDYGVISSKFWTTGSGKRLRGDSQAQLVAQYLLSCSHGNPIRLFYVALPTICHELGVVTDVADPRYAFAAFHSLDDVRAALRRCSAVGLLHYDEEAELAWIPNAAEFAIGKSLGAKDKRRAWIERTVASFGSHRYARQFLTRYGDMYGLAVGRPPRAEAAEVPLPVDVAPNQEAPSKPLPDSQEAPSEPPPQPRKGPSPDLDPPSFLDPSGGVSDRDQVSDRLAAVAGRPADVVPLRPLAGTSAEDRSPPAAGAELAARLNSETMRDGALGFTAEAWRDGVGEVLKIPVPRLTPNEVRDLQLLIDAYAPRYESAEDLCQWVRDMSRDFTQHAVDSKKAGYGLKPAKAKDWILANPWLVTGAPPPTERPSAVFPIRRQA